MPFEGITNSLKELEDLSNLDITPEVGIITGLIKTQDNISNERISAPDSTTFAQSSLVIGNSNSNTGQLNVYGEAVVSGKANGAPALIVENGEFQVTGDAATEFGGDVDVGGACNVTGNMTIASETQSTNKETGALVVKGGVGIENDTNVGGAISGASLTIGASAGVTNAGQITGTSLAVGTGGTNTIQGGELTIGASAGVTNAGQITGTSLALGTGGTNTIQAGPISGTSLAVGTGGTNTIQGGELTIGASAGVTNAGQITGTSLALGTGAANTIQAGPISETSPAEHWRY